MKLLIIDDERPARLELRFLIEELTGKATIFEAQSGREALEIIHNSNSGMDAAFIDIALGDCNGMALAKELLELQEHLKIVFATAYDTYAVKAFELNAVDYLLKPFEKHRVEMALKRVERLMVQKDPGEHHLKEFVDRMAGKVNKLSLWTGDRVMLIAINTIVFVATAGRTCRICTLQGEFQSPQTLGYFEQKFKEHPFFRVNRSYLVNLDHILEIQPWFNNGFLLKMSHYETEEIGISRNHIKEFRRLFDF